MAITAPTGIEPLLLDFLAYLEFERGLSRNTLEAYRSDLLQYGAGCTSAGSTRSRSRTPSSPTSSPASPRATRPRSARRSRRPRSSARSPACGPSTATCAAQELIHDDPTAHIRAPRQSRRLPKVLSRDEVAKLLEQPAGTEPPALRDRALLELMYACGLRASEAIDLDVGDIDLEECILRTRGKGSKERLVPVGSTAARAVARLPPARPPDAGRPAPREAPVRQPPRRRA